MRSFTTYGISVAAIAALSWFIIYDQRTPFDFVSGQAQSAWCDEKNTAPAPEAIKPGACISVPLTLLWHRVDCDMDVARMIRDGRGDDHKVPSGLRSSVPPPARDIGRVLVSHRTVAIPGIAAPYETPGPMPHYRATVKMKCGLLGGLHTITIEIPPVPFEIKAPEK